MRPAAAGETVERAASFFTSQAFTRYSLVAKSLASKEHASNIVSALVFVPPPGCLRATIVPGQYMLVQVRDGR